MSPLVFRIKSFDEHSDMGLDNLITRVQFLLTSLDALMSYSFQVVNIIQRNIVEEQTAV